MAEDTVDPKDTTNALPAQRILETTPGREIDLSAFEAAVAGPDADGPVLEWAVVWPDGRTLVLDSEDSALAVACGTPTCTLIRRHVAPWLRSGPPG